jgi:DNA topoisomerase IB
VTSKSLLARFKSLVIPPAWTSVWIAPTPDAHIQATGTDARGRKQYRYHPDWTAHRNRAKFDTLAEFGAALPAIRARIDRDLRLPGLPRDKVAACILHLMDRTLIRIGNAEYARDNDSYGLTTILNKHARVAGSQVHFRFKAKSGRECDASIDSPRAARIVRACQDLPGQELFCYRTETGDVRDIGSSDVNEYLASITGQPFTAKDFRTWGGTCAAAECLSRMARSRVARTSPSSGLPVAGANQRATGRATDPRVFERVSASRAKRSLPASWRDPQLSKTTLKHLETAALRAAADALGNTVAVCRKFYVHHALMDACASGRLHTAFTRAARAGPRRLSTTERAVLLLLTRRGTGLQPVNAPSDRAHHLHERAHRPSRKAAA